MLLIFDSWRLARNQSPGGRECLLDSEMRRERRRKMNKKKKKERTENEKQRERSKKREK